MTPKCRGQAFFVAIGKPESRCTKLFSWDLCSFAFDASPQSLSLTIDYEIPNNPAPAFMAWQIIIEFFRNLP